MAAVCGYVIEAILSKLPVKSLLRFRCACKIWYSLISDPQFCKITMRPGVMIRKDSRDFSTKTIESLLATKGRAPTPAAPVSFPWETEVGDDYNNEYTCLGSCNGLICMYFRNSCGIGRTGLIICNPSTRKFKSLTHPRRCLECDRWTYTGFGYDELIDDYKLVWINFREASLHVFALKSNTWRRQAVNYGIAVGEHTSPGGGGVTGVFCSRAIHWIVNCFLRERRILALDLPTEKFRLLKFPDTRTNPNAWIGSLDGGERLWLCDNVCDDDGFLVSRLWMMKEYGVESSWTKILSIRGYAHVRYPIRFWKEKEGKEMVVICMLTSNRSRIVKLRVEGEKVKKKEEILLRAPSTSSVILHMEESLVSIN